MNPRQLIIFLAINLLLVFVVSSTIQAEDLSAEHQQALQSEAIPSYPGSIFISSDDTEELTVLWFQTSDSPAVIMAWYRQQLSYWSEIETSGTKVLYKGPPGLEVGQISDIPYIFSRRTTESDANMSEITIRLPKK